MIPEIPKTFLTVAVAVWILVESLGKIRWLNIVLGKELLALIIGVIAIIAGILTGFFSGNIFEVVVIGIIAIYITQDFHDKAINVARDKIIK